MTSAMLVFLGSVSLSLGILLALVAYLPRSVQHIFHFESTEALRRFAGVLGPLFVALGLASTSSLLYLRHETATSYTPPHSLNKRMDDELQKAWKELRDGRIAYEPFRKMTEGRPETVRVRIAKGTTIDIKSGFTEPVSVEALKLSGAVSAYLTADSDEFKIEAQSSDSQALVGSFTDWIWRVTPLRPGQLTLNLRIVAHVRLSNGATEDHDILVKATQISVQSDRRWRMVKFWDQNWQWILGSPIVIAILTWLVRRFMKSE